MGAPGPGGLPPQGMMGGMGGPPMMNGGELAFPFPFVSPLLAMLDAAMPSRTSACFKETTCVSRPAVRSARCLRLPPLIADLPPPLCPSPPGFRPPPNGQPPFFQQQPPPNTSHLGHHQPLPQQNLPFRPPPFQQNGVASPYGGPPPQNGYGVSPSQYTPQQPPHMAGGPGFGGSPGGYRPPQPNFGTPPPSSGPAGGAPGFAEQAAPYTPGGGAGLRINPDRLRMLGSGGQ